MNDEELSKVRGVIKEEMNVALEPVTKKLDALWDQTVKLTEEVEEIKENFGSQTTFLKETEEKNEDNMGKFNKRVIAVEDRLGIVPPPELTFIK